MTKKEFESLRLSKVSWREYYGDGILEGIEFEWSNGKKSKAYGEAFRYGLEKSITIPEDRTITSICVFYDSRYLIGMQFFDSQGK